nr:hypothetical protein [Priestia megaterium]
MLGVESNQYALFLNGAPVVGTVYGSGAGTQQDNGQAIIAIAAGDVLSLRNHTSDAASDLISGIIHQNYRWVREWGYDVEDVLASHDDGRTYASVQRAGQ